MIEVLVDRQFWTNELSKRGLESPGREEAVLRALKRIEQRKQRKRKPRSNKKK